MTIEEAIKQVNEFQEWIIKNIRVSDAIIVLLRVAEAWVKTRAAIPLLPTNPPPPVAEAVARECGQLALRTMMDGLLNRTPKSDIQRVREWVNRNVLMPQTVISRNSILEFLHQLEKEKDRDA